MEFPDASYSVVVNCCTYTLWSTKTWQATLCLKKSSHSPAICLRFLQHLQPFEFFISQRSVATCIDFVENFKALQQFKNCENRLSYREFKGGNFLKTQYILECNSVKYWPISLIFFATRYEYDTGHICHFIRFLAELNRIYLDCILCMLLYVLNVLFLWYDMCRNFV